MGLFKTYSEKEVKRVKPIVEKINSLEPEVQKLSDDELRDKTVEFKDRLAKGETLDSILPEAFAVVREASKRVLVMRHFDVQLIGGIILHQGRIAGRRTLPDRLFQNQRLCRRTDSRSALYAGAAGQARRQGR